MQWMLDTGWVNGWMDQWILDGWKWVGWIEVKWMNGCWMNGWMEVGLTDEC